MLSFPALFFGFNRSIMVLTCFSSIGVKLRVHGPLLCVNKKKNLVFHLCLYFLQV